MKVTGEGGGPTGKEGVGTRRIVYELGRKAERVESLFVLGGKTKFQVRITN